MFIFIATLSANAFLTDSADQSQWWHLQVIMLKKRQQQLVRHLQVMLLKLI